MTVYRHPDGAYRRYPPRELPPETLKPVPGRPNWWIGRDGVPRCIEPPKPATQPDVPI